MPDLGTLPKDDSSLTPPAGPEPKKPSYPSFSLNDDKVDAVKGDETCAVGDEYTATVKLRVSSVSDDNYGKSLRFDVISLDGFTPAEGSADDEADEAGETDETDESDTEATDEKPSTLSDDEEENVLGYKRPAKSAPPFTGKGKDLID